MKFIKLKYIFTFAFYNYLAWNNVAQILKYTWVWIGVWTWRIGIANCFNTTFRFRLRYWLRLRPHPWIMPFSRSNIFCSCSSYHIWTFRSRFIWFLFYSIFWFTFPAYFFFFFFTFSRFSSRRSFSSRRKGWFGGSSAIRWRSLWYKITQFKVYQISFPKIKQIFSTFFWHQKWPRLDLGKKKLLIILSVIYGNL